MNVIEQMVLGLKEDFADLMVVSLIVTLIGIAIVIVVHNEN